MIPPTPIATRTDPRLHYTTLFRPAGRDLQKYLRSRHPTHRYRAQELAFRRIEGRRRTRRRYLLGHRDGQAQWRRAAGLYRRCHREDRLRLARIPLGRAHAVELAVRAAADRSGRVTEVFRPRLLRFYIVCWVYIWIEESRFHARKVPINGIKLNHNLRICVLLDR